MKRSLPFERQDSKSAQSHQALPWLDLKNMPLALDLLIIIKTIRIVVLGKGQ